MRRHLKGHAAKVEREFVKSLASQTIGAYSRPYRTVVARLRRLERSALPQLPRQKSLARELQRRIAEEIFHQALLHDCSLAVCRGRLTLLSQLGFTNIERKGHFHLLYSRWALERGHNRLAYRTATAMAKEIERSLRRRKSLLGKEILELLRTVLYEFEETTYREPGEHGNKAIVFPGRSRT